MTHRLLVKCLAGDAQHVHVRAYDAARGLLVKPQGLLAGIGAKGLCRLGHKIVVVRSSWQLMQTAAKCSCTTAKVADSILLQDSGGYVRNYA